MSFNFSDNITVVEPQNLYKWAKVWGKVQKRYYKEDIYLRREKQIEDFVQQKVFLELSIKVKKDWRNSEQDLNRWGYKQ